MPSKTGFRAHTPLRSIFQWVTVQMKERKDEEVPGLARKVWVEEAGRMMWKSGSVFAKTLWKNGLCMTNYFIEATLVRPDLFMHVPAFSRVCMGSFFSAKKFAQCGYIESRWASECPFCERKIPDSLEHYLVECTKWEDARQETISQLLSAWSGGRERLPSRRTSQGYLKGIVALQSWRLSGSYRRDESPAWFSTSSGGKGARKVRERVLRVMEKTFEFVSLTRLERNRILQALAHEYEQLKPRPVDGMVSIDGRRESRDVPG